MNDQPDILRNEKWKGPRPAILWLVMLAGIFLIGLVAAPFLPGGPGSLSEWITAGLLLFVISFTAATVLLWLWLAARWFCCWRNLKRFAIAGTGLAALVAIFYFEENWRGRRAWTQFQRQWQAQGEHVALAGVMPPRVPDDQNFALTDIAFTSYGQILTRDGKLIPPEKRDGHFASRMRMPVTRTYPGLTNGAAGDWMKGEFVSLEAWQRHYRDLAAATNEFPVPARPQSPPVDVLLALSRYADVIDELRTASRLPGSRFPINYDCEPPWNVSLPHLAAFKSCAQVLRLRSVARLQNGQTEQAFDDVQLGLELTDKIRDEPLLISHLVRVAMMELMLQPVWEGLANRQWSEGQLAALDEALWKLNFAAAWKLSMRGELAAVSDSIEYLRRHPEKLRDLAGLTDLNGHKFGPQLPRPWAARLIPAGWYCQNQARYARTLEAHYFPLASPDARTFYPEAARRAEAALAAEGSGPFNLCARLALPTLSISAKKLARGQVALNLARTAIALERWRLTHERFPDSLDVLVPKCIARVPVDAIGGRPLKYRCEQGDRFVLYSVGWNENDDGGVATVKKDGAVELESGDWVWQYPRAIPK